MRDPTKFADWDEVWRHRAGAYNLANAREPEARAAERDALLERLRLAPGLTILEVGAAGGYLSAGIRARLGDAARLLAIESADAHAGALPPYLERVPASTITRFALADASVVRVANLASLHHTADDTGFFTESHRVLRPGGVLAVADVRAGSRVARWLNEFVDAANPEGHRGRFYEEGELRERLTRAGFRHADEETVPLAWTFANATRMTAFCRLLFGLERAPPRAVETAARAILGVEEDDGAVRLRWELVYAHGFR